jgi:hypothetical protein
MTFSIIIFRSQAGPDGNSLELSHGQEVGLTVAGAQCE